MYHNILIQRRSSPLLLSPPTILLSATSTDDDKPPPPPPPPAINDPEPTPTQIWELPPANPGTRPHYKPHARPTLLPANTIPEDDAEKWRVPTILVLTISIALGVAMMLFLMWVAYRRLMKLRQEQQREARERREMIMRI